MEPRKTPIQTRSRARVDLILQSAKKVLRKQGLNAFSTTAIAAQAGIPIGSIYQYFPNKKSILIAIYEEYLQSIRAVFGEFEETDFLAMPRDQALRQLFGAILTAELSDHIEDELEKAIILYPELAEIDRQHREKTATMVASLLKKMGSPWSKAKLVRLAQFVYFLNSGIWSYRAEVQPPKKELREWEMDVIVSRLERCFEAQ